MTRLLWLVFLPLAGCTHPLEGIWLVSFRLTEGTEGDDYVDAPSTASLPLWLHHSGSGSFVVDGLVHQEGERRSLEGVFAYGAFSADATWGVEHHPHWCNPYAYQAELEFDGVLTADLGLEGELVATTTPDERTCEPPIGPAGTEHRWLATGVFVRPTLREVSASAVGEKSFRVGYLGDYLLSYSDFWYSYDPPKGSGD